MNKLTGSRSSGYFVRTILLIMCVIATSAVADDDPALLESRALAQSFGTQLQTALQTAMADGGVVAAMTVCKDKAPQIAAQLSRESGARVSRTSRRFRNPSNAPEPWQIAILESFESEITTASQVPERIDRYDGGIRYMKAIRIQPLCLACHGESLSDDVRDSLDELYPHDRARDYSLNDLRGAFSILWPASE